MTVNGDLIGDDALANFIATEVLTLSQQAALLVLLKAVGNGVDSNITQGSFSPEYLSVWASSDSIASVNHNIFAASSYTSGVFSVFGASSGITHNTSTGRFTVPSTGAYRVTVSVPLMAASSSLVTIKIKKSGTIYTSVDHFIHTAVDPMSTSVDIIALATAGQYFECIVTSPATHIVKKGTSMTIVRVG